MKLNFDYTLNNHYKWGFGDDWYNEPTQHKPYKVHIGAVTRPVKSFREECINAAKLIAEKATKPILVGLSGGGDSQVACLSFREAGIPFKVIIVHLYDVNWKEVNTHDITNAFKFCETYGIEYIEQHINLDYFYRDDGVSHAEKYGFTQLHTITQCAVIDYVSDEYCYIMAGGDIMFSPYLNFITPDVEQPRIAQSSRDLVRSCWWSGPQPILQYMIDKGCEGTTKFFMYTPELIASFLTHPVTTQYLDNEDVIVGTFTDWFKNPNGWWKCFHYLYKPMMIKQEFPEVLAVKKQTGYEVMESKTSTFDELKPPMMVYQKLITTATRGCTSGQVIAIPIPDLIKYIQTPHTEGDVLTATRVIR